MWRRKPKDLECAWWALKQHWGAASVLVFQEKLHEKCNYRNTDKRAAEWHRLLLGHVCLTEKQPFNSWSCQCKVQSAWEKHHLWIRINIPPIFSQKMLSTKVQLSFVSWVVWGLKTPLSLQSFSPSSPLPPCSMSESVRCVREKLAMLAGEMEKRE